MPSPAKGESQQDYISRCISQLRHEGYGQKEAIGRCYGMYRHYKKKARHEYLKK